MDPFHRDTLNPSGIYAAIDTYDMGKVIEEAIKAIIHKNCIRSALFFKYTFNTNARKCRIKSKEARMSGNEYYKMGKMQQAIRLYNQALALAPISSEEMILAYSNRSAIFFHRRYITACLKDINACLSLGCSGTVAEKLIKRREDASQLLYQDFALKKNGFSSFFKLDDHNPNVPCARADVRFETDGVKTITADADLKVGSVVGIERAFVTIPTDKYITCYYCNQSELCLYPCEGCGVLFCGDECREQCLKEYHCIECQIADSSLITSAEIGVAIQAAIKMSLMMTWDDLVAASTNMGATRLQTATVKQAFNSTEPLSVLSYTENGRVMEGSMYNGSIQFAVILLRLLQFSKHYFPEEEDKRLSAVLALGRIMLNLFVNFTNVIEIQNPVFNIDNKKLSYYRHISLGIFSMSSKLKHSCAPNLLALSSNDTIHLIALRTIKQGEELTLSYGAIFYDIKAHKDAIQRMNMLFISTRKMCADCPVCLGNWSSESAVTIEMTKQQAKYFEKLDYYTKSYLNMNNYFKQYLRAICDVLDSFPYNSKQHLTAFHCLRDLLSSAMISSRQNNVNFLFS